MKSTNPTYFSDLNHKPHSDEHREAHIKSFSQRTREQAGQLVAAFLVGILFLLLVDRSQSSVQSPAITPKSEKLMTANEVAVILNISKAKAYQLISWGEILSVQFGRTTSVRLQDLGKFLKDHIVHAK